jgi:hypothetical protein
MERILGARAVRGLVANCGKAFSLASNLRQS